MARVELARPVAALLDVEFMIDPTRMHVATRLGPIHLDMSYPEALLYYQRLGDALMRLRSVETGPTEGDPTCEYSKPSLLLFQS